jgi:hypothetical protein
MLRMYQILHKKVSPILFTQYCCGALPSYAYVLIAVSQLLVFTWYYFRDTLTRHLSIHNSDQGQTQPSKRSSVNRVTRACANCAKSRLRCDGEKPCGRCKFKGITCIYPGSKRSRIRSTVQVANQHQIRTANDPGILTPLPQNKEQQKPQLPENVEGNQAMATMVDRTTLDALVVALDSSAHSAMGLEPDELSLSLDNDAMKTQGVSKLSMVFQEIPSEERWPMIR